MGYQDTKHNVLTAGAATGEAKWSALRAFFNGGGSERWTLANPAAAGTAGMVLEQVNPTTPPVFLCIRRVTGGATWHVGADTNGSLLLNPGSTSGAMTSTDPEAVVECSYTPDTGHTKLLVCEHDDAVTILEYGTVSENTMPKGIHAGIVYVPADPTWPANRSQGVGVILGPVTIAGGGTFSAHWLSSGGTAVQSGVKVLNEQWQPYSTGGADSATQSADVVLPGGPAAVAAPVAIGLSNSAASRFIAGGLVMKWLRFVSADAAGGGAPGTRYELGDDAWVRIGAANSTLQRMCVSCQKDKATR